MNNSIIVGGRIRTCLLRNVLWGVYWGICGAVFYSLVAGLIYLVGGSEPFARHSSTLGMTIIGYFVGGILAGLIIGILRPLNRWAWGAGVVGFLAAIPIWAGMRVAIHGLKPVSWSDVETIIQLSALFGPICGVVARSRWPRGAATPFD